MVTIQRNIDHQFLVTIPNVQPGRVTVMPPPEYRGMRISFSGIGKPILPLGARRALVRANIERRCAGHVRRQRRVRR